MRISLQICYVEKKGSTEHFPILHTQTQKKKFKTILEQIENSKKERTFLKSFEYSIC